MRKLPSEYQLISVQELNSLMVSPLGRDEFTLTFGDDTRNCHEGQETNRCISPALAPVFESQLEIRRQAFPAAPACASGVAD